MACCASTDRQAGVLGPTVLPQHARQQQQQQQQQTLPHERTGPAAAGPTGHFVSPFDQQMQMFYGLGGGSEAAAAAAAAKAERQAVLMEMGADAAARAAAAGMVAAGMMPTGVPSPAAATAAAAVPAQLSAGGGFPGGVVFVWVDESARNVMGMPDVGIPPSGK